MTGNALKVHVTVVGFIVKGPRARLRLPAIRVTLEAGAVTQRKTQMIGFFEVANDVLHGIPSSDGFDDEFVGESRADVAIDAFNLTLVEVGASERHHPRGIGHEVFEDVFVQMASDAKAIILFEVIGNFHRRDKAHETKG
jgi:hypothetical protein